MERDKENRRQDDKQQPPKENKMQASRDGQKNDGELVVLSPPVSILTVGQICLKLLLS